jgi:hypothetical protein
MRIRLPLYPLLRLLTLRVWRGCMEARQRGKFACSLLNFPVSFGLMKSRSFECKIYDEFATEVSDAMRLNAYV